MSNAGSETCSLHNTRLPRVQAIESMIKFLGSSSNWRRPWEPAFVPALASLSQSSGNVCPTVPTWLCFLLLAIVYKPAPKETVKNWHQDSLFSKNTKETEKWDGKADVTADVLQVTASLRKGHATQTQSNQEPQSQPQQGLRRWGESRQAVCPFAWDTMVHKNPKSIAFQILCRRSGQVTQRGGRYLL